MQTYLCKDCKGYQYSASATKDDEPCIYCGGKVELVINPGPIIEGDKADDEKGIA